MKYLNTEFVLSTPISNHINVVKMSGLKDYLSYFPLLQRISNLMVKLWDNDLQVDGSFSEAHE